MFTQTYKNWLKGILIGLAVIAGVILAVFLFSTLLDVSCVIYLSKLTPSISAINLINPHLDKAVTSLLLAIMAFVFFRHRAISPRPIRRRISSGFIVIYLLVALKQLDAAYSTWGHLFDEQGNSRFSYGCDFDNRVGLFTNRLTHPTTNEPLTPLTRDNAWEYEVLRTRSFQEVTNPAITAWFTRPGKPELWYSERRDGLHFFNMPAHDPAENTLLKPVTQELHDSYYADKEKQNASQDIATIKADSAVNLSSSIPAFSLPSSTPASVGPPLILPDAQSQSDDIKIIVSIPYVIVYPDGHKGERMVIEKSEPFKGLFHWRGDMKHWMLCPKNCLLHNAVTGQWESTYAIYAEDHPKEAAKLQSEYEAKCPLEPKDFYKSAFLGKVPHGGHF